MIRYLCGMDQGRIVMKRTGIIFAVSYLAVMLCLQSCNIDFSDGDRAGTITKFSHKGLICKTWEGELLMGGFRQTTDSQVANVFQFSVDANNAAVIKKLQDAMLAGQPVVLRYNQMMMTSMCRGSTSYYIIDVLTAQR
jgi:hypothetical protein